MNIVETIAKNSRMRREEVGMTQKEVADISGIDQSGISRIERGLMPDLPVASLPRLAAALRCKVDDLIR